MKIFLSKKEIELLNKEYETTNDIYTNKESVITQIFAIKINNLMRTDYELASSYIDRVLKISSICEENINLSDYDIKNVKIFLTIDEDTLSGFTSTQKQKETGFFSNTVKIVNDFIITNPTNKERPLVVENLLKETNVICLHSFTKVAHNELETRFLRDINDRFSYIMYTEYQFRKNEFLRLPLTDDEKTNLIKLYDKNKNNTGQAYVEKYIEKMFKEYILEHATMCIYDLMHILKTHMPKKMFDINYLYDKLLERVDDLIISSLNSSIYKSKYRDKPLVILDWLFIKDDIFNFIENKNKELNLEKVFRNKILRINNIYSFIYNAINDKLKECNLNSFNLNFKEPIKPTFTNCKLLKKSITIGKNKYLYNFIGFVDDNKKLHILDPIFKIDNLLKLKITHEDDLLYAVPKETKNLLINLNKKLVDAIKDSGYTPIDNGRAKRNEIINYY